MTCWKVFFFGFVLKGFPEFPEDEIVSVPDAKYTKGEFEVCAPK